MSQSNSDSLEILSISDLKCLFRIPPYQRGYRWERQQVVQLLDDLFTHINSHKGDVRDEDYTPYYLQPVVIAPIPNSVNLGGDLDSSYSDRLDLIDGQQRLTTVWLVLKYLSEAKLLASEREDDDLLSDIDPTPPYDITFATRSDSRDFMRRLAVCLNKSTKDEREKERDDVKEDARQDPDFLYMWHAYDAIASWFKTKEHRRRTEEIALLLLNHVKVIWYKLNEAVPNWKKFVDLNMGKIPLTNSELIKALFLRSSNFNEASREYEQQTIIAQWDDMERELTDEKFWGFLTRKKATDYPTKIDLIFNLIAGKTDNEERDDFFTFRKFERFFVEEKKMTGKEKWNIVHLRYQRLRDWYNDRNMFHRIGYLVAVNYPANALQSVFNYAYPEPYKAEGRSKAEIATQVAVWVKESLQLPEGIYSFKELTYDHDSEEDKNKPGRPHNDCIHKYLLLHNVMTTDEIGDVTVRFPFYCHNQKFWSLEHIHAQHSEGLSKASQWQEWMRLQSESLKGQLVSISKKELVEKANQMIEKMSKYQGSDGENAFVDLQNEFNALMTLINKRHAETSLHSMGNLALLGRDENSALNKSTFDVKRRKVIETLPANYVPISTERVFLKAISGYELNPDGSKNKDNPYSCDTDHIFFWGQDDANAYLKDIESKLYQYLK